MKRIILALAFAVSPLAVQAATLQEEANIKVALAFYDAALNQKDWDKTSALIGETYKQHNLSAADGQAGIKAHIENLAKNFPLNHGDVRQVFADGDLVALFILSKRTPESRGNAIVDMFRIKDGKVIEHWDVVQPVPETSMNRNGVF